MRTLVAAAVLAVLCGCAGNGAPGESVADGDTSSGGDTARPRSPAASDRDAGTVLERPDLPSDDARPGQCHDTCQPAARRCAGDAVQQCEDLDGDGCVEWSPPRACDAGATCAAGACRPVACAVRGCTAPGARKCEGTGYVTCRADTDGCLRWTAPVPCAPGQVCSDGLCTGACADACSPAGATQCDGDGVATCEDTNGDGCLEWSEPNPCPPGQACAAGACSAACTDACSAAGDTQCQGDAVQTCGDLDGDGCLEWSEPSPCPPGQACAGGQCVLPCADECAQVGDTTCGDGGVRTCDDWNADGCLEWGTGTPCGPTEECQDGACVAAPPPAKVVISEVVYDGVQGDEDEVFVELMAPAGLDLTGFSLVGVNGNGGKVYAKIALDGTVPSDGLFVVAHPNAAPALAAQADLVAAKVNFQNGPDSIQVRWGDTVVDAVGYGDFVNAVFAGEGAPAVDVPEGHALCRPDGSPDTDNNATDFTDCPTPTPGAPNAPTVQPPAAGACCEVHTGPGCEQSACSTCVCGLDAFCCSNAWDATCASEAAEACATVCACPTAPPSCCKAAAGPGCVLPDCEACVCSSDTYCCTTHWDATCGDEAVAQCGSVCGCN